MANVAEVAEFRSFLTCVYRRQYPPSRREKEPVFFRFNCDLAPESGKPIVRPEDVCDHWRGATLGFE